MTCVATRPREAFSARKAARSMKELWDRPGSRPRPTFLEPHSALWVRCFDEQNESVPNGLALGLLAVGHTHRCGVYCQHAAGDRLGLRGISLPIQSYFGFHRIRMAARRLAARPGGAPSERRLVGRNFSRSHAPHRVVRAQPKSVLGVAYDPALVAVRGCSRRRGLALVSRQTRRPSALARAASLADTQTTRARDVLEPRRRVRRPLCRPLSALAGRSAARRVLPRIQAERRRLHDHDIHLRRPRMVHSARRNALGLALRAVSESAVSASAG